MQLSLIGDNVMSSPQIYKGEAIRYVDPLKKADTVRQRALIQAEASCRTCMHYSIKSGNCSALSKKVKFYNCCKLHNLEILK